MLYRIVVLKVFNCLWGILFRWIQMNSMKVAEESLRQWPTPSRFCSSVPWEVVLCGVQPIITLDFKRFLITDSLIQSEPNLKQFKTIASFQQLEVLPLLNDDRL